MSKFHVVKRLSLDFLGDDWKECYLEFKALTIREFKDFTGLIGVDQADADAVLAAFSLTIGILQTVYLKGKAIDQDKTIIDVSKEDLAEMPLEVINRATSFLLQKSPTPA